MKKTLLTLTLLYLIAGPVLLSQSTSKATLEIEFKGVRSNKGQMSIGINTSSEGWPRKAEVELQFKKAAIENNGTYIAVIENMSFGTYAISVLDDINSNIEMEMFLGIPKEGWGFSMNPPFKLSEPKFDLCSFELDEPLKRITIQLHYIGKSK